jgi:hypothetical protein
MQKIQEILTIDFHTFFSFVSLNRNFLLAMNGPGVRAAAISATVGEFSTRTFH